MEKSCFKVGMKNCFLAPNIDKNRLFLVHFLKIFDFRDFRVENVTFWCLEDYYIFVTLRGIFEGGYLGRQKELYDVLGHFSLVGVPKYHSHTSKIK